MNDFKLPQKLLSDMAGKRNVAVLTGAGISAESGLVTFRGKEGIWNKMRPEELASMDGFMANPELVWEWYNYRRSVLAEAKPNPAHHALAKWESACPKFTLITQNVDGLHQMAGSKSVLELHGSIKINCCLSCAQESSDEPVRYEGKIPCCSCGGRLRPGVVWFGEMLPEAVLSQAFQASTECDLFLAVGTSAVVYPAASLPEIAFESGALTIEINLEHTPFTESAHFHLAAQAGLAVPALYNAWSHCNMTASNNT